MKSNNNSIFNAKAFAMFTVSTSHNRELFTDHIIKESLNNSAKALQESGKILQDKKRYKEHMMKHGSLNQAANAFFDLN